MMDGTMFSHKTVSVILKLYPFKHQMNKIFLLVVLMLTITILLTHVYYITFQM